LKARSRTRKCNEMSKSKSERTFCWREITAFHQITIEEHNINSTKIS